MTFKLEIESLVREAAKKLYDLDVDPVIEHPAQESHGDYATGIAMDLAKKLKKKPLEVAGELKSQISDLEFPIIQSIEVAPPGFLNFWLASTALAGEVNEVNKQKDRYGSSATGRGRTVVIDYSSPNIAKRFGIGHLRSTVIGQALYNLDKIHGFRVIGDNHLGDWGTQFGSLLAQISNQHLAISNLTIDKLEELYVDFHQRAEGDPKLMEEARAWFKKLEEGDQEARSLWKAVVSVSIKEFDRIYALLGVKFDYAYGESFYEDKMPSVIKEVRGKGLSKKSEGAEIVEFENLPPAILVKSDGTTTYFTRDLATIKFRLEKWQPQFITYEVGADQKLHFQQVFETIKRLGWADGVTLRHVAHGLIRLPADRQDLRSGKMSTRRGQTIKLEDVLDEAIRRAGKLIGSSAGLGATEKAVGIGAIKYFDLMHQPQTDIIFDWEKLFLLEGNSGPYLQYTYARAMSVLRKANALKPLAVSHKPLASEAESPLLRYIYRFPEALDDAAENYSPNLICNYLFELAQRFNSFYDKAPIIKAESEELKALRLALTSATAQVVKNGLTILGIETPERL